MRQDTGLYSIKGFQRALTHVDETTKKLARGVTNDDAATLVLRWKNASWTQASLQRVLEVFTLAKMGAEHEDLLRVKYSRQGRGVGSDMGQWTNPKVDATCLLCKKQVIAAELPDRG